MVGKYVELADSYKSLNESLLHASVHNDISLKLNLLIQKILKNKHENAK